MTIGRALCSFRNPRNTNSQFKSLQWVVPVDLIILTRFNSMNDSVCSVYQLNYILLRWFPFWSENIVKKVNSNDIFCFQNGLKHTKKSDRWHQNLFLSEYDSHKNIYICILTPFTGGVFAYFHHNPIVSIKKKTYQK